MTEVKFFVYGSMTEGLVHFEKIREFITAQQPARCLGAAYRLQVGYPVYLEQGEDWVPGQLVSVQATDLLFTLLDQFHGYNEQLPEKSLYFKKTCQVQTEDGEQHQAYVYALNPAKLPKQSQRIPSGDWVRSMQELPPLTESLTERQIQYIQKLGASTGREIVPIDLPLYRELMNLEIIVDKGRRLALSKLGHEIYRYLA